MSTTPGIDTIKTRFGIVGHNHGLNTALEIATRVAPTEVTVLILGENGSGKDVFSRIIHQYSRRKHKPFIAINCGAIPEGTMDSELFGHEKGSFTSAIDNRKGYFEEVNGGTIFLDEVAEMPLQTQSKLLRLLENGEYLRVGSSKVRKTDVRVIAATNKNLVELIRKGKFREDLYFRLNTVTIQVPPLRDRGDDIEILFRFFMDEFATNYGRMAMVLTPEALNMLYDYRWPGNVRELRHFVEKLLVLEEGEYLTPEIINRHLNIRENYLPSPMANASAETGAGLNGGIEGNSRQLEMIYKMLIDLKEEVGDLKKLLFVSMRDINYPQPGTTDYLPMANEPSEPFYTTPIYPGSGDPAPPAPVKTPPLLEESLSLEKKEKEMIEKALRKHRNNRKKAAQELGISERTLYRKIRQFELTQ